MELNQVYCSNCNSSNVTAQKHGFSAGKAVAGAVLTGGIGVLAGLHGSTDIDITCLNCGHKWNPRKLFEQKRKDQFQKEFMDLKKWKSAIYEAYDKKDFDTAEAIYLSKYSFNARMNNIHEVYKFYKKGDRQITYLAIVFLAVVAVIIALIIT